MAICSLNLRSQAELHALRLSNQLPQKDFWVEDNPVSLAFSCWTNKGNFVAERLREGALDGGGNRSPTGFGSFLPSNSINGANILKHLSPTRCRSLR